ncbi:MAG: U32 family peptidase [Candidatus Aenigmarchaeota archaeon]|nr:U32 family peptidase [Candidatus Aenigmarchaeota archaeon]
MKKPELLLPVKSWPNLKAVIPYADAVYFGAKELNMRVRSGNFALSELKKVVEECHKNNIKAYLAVNTVIYPEDTKKLEKVLDAAKNAKIDAIICWDGAVIDAARKRNIPIHISTQANISNANTALLYKKLGAKRVVLARECSLKDIKAINKETDIEIEAFVHGAMCVSISGRCYLSSYLYGKSANCGDCLQPCRQQWKLVNEDKKEIVCEGKYLMSAKDLCMIAHIPELIKAGIGSFKVEGRLRDARYVEVVGKCYRAAIDAHFQSPETAGLSRQRKALKSLKPNQANHRLKSVVSPKFHDFEKTFDSKKVEGWLKELKSVYNRGFSTGFYFQKPGKKEFTYNSSNSHASHARKQAGIVTNYYPKNKVAAVRIIAGKIHVGDEIIIEGKTTYFRQPIGSIENNAKPSNFAEKGDIVGIKTSKKARKNDYLYVLVKNSK